MNSPSQVWVLNILYVQIILKYRKKLVLREYIRLTFIQKRHERETRYTYNRLKRNPWGTEIHKQAGGANRLKFSCAQLFSEKDGLGGLHIHRITQTTG